MKLEKFKEKDNKKKITIGISIVLVLLVAGIIVYRSFAFYEEKKAFDVIKGQIPDQNYDLKLSYYVDNNYQETIPEGTNYSVSVTCTNGATGEWDYEAWGPVITNLTSTRTKCKLSFQTGGYQESILNGTDPVLASGLIPVTIEDDGTVKKADTRTEWYSYANQRWANAVILEDESITYQNGEVIPESNIESYFVWIPKYQYKLWDLGQYETLSTSVEKKEQTIDIIFGDYDTVDKEGECKTPGVSGETGNCKVGDYMTHPAFQAFGVKGLWVGKFETGYKGATSTTGAESNTYDSDKVIIKPNVYSWRSVNVSNAHLNSYNYKREYDSHMMKNTEWGAVAYLSHSKYGINTEVRINNNSSYITGYAGVETPTIGNTGTTIGEGNRVESTALGNDGTYTVNYFSITKLAINKLASTTGNKTGIYDMNGGAEEFVMAYTAEFANGRERSGITSIYPDFFTNSSWNIYYDKYSATVDTEYNDRILGDATGEMGPFWSDHLTSWYDDIMMLMDSYYPWPIRGTHYINGSYAGIFACGKSLGSGGAAWGSFRIVLAI